MTSAAKPPLGECPLTASHTRRACDNGGSCWCIENPDEVAAINAHPEVIKARSAAQDQRTINFAAAREIAGELQRGLVTTATGYKHITNLSKRGATEAFRQAGEIMEALLDERERLEAELHDA